MRAAPQRRLERRPNVTHHKAAAPAPVQQELDPPEPAVSVRIGGTRIEMDKVPRLPHRVKVALTSASVAVAVYVTHHLHYWR